MTDDKAKAPDDQSGTVEVGIRTDAVQMLVCPGCGVEIDTVGIPSFTEIACPTCRTRQTVPAKLAHFRLLSVIGTGGMGAVFLAQDDTLNRRVAIKVMLSSIGEDRVDLETFRKEAQAAARINHPNIVQIYSFGEEKGQPYLVMELVNGDRLDDMIESGEALDPAFVMRVGMEIADGLSAAQAANLVHGDIKPENVLFDERTQAKLVDFGIASMLSSKDSGNEVWGTPFYIAPEKARRQKADVRSDIYSLGATLYHAIAGQPPYDGEDAVAVIRARFLGPPKSLTELRPGIDPQVVAIIERMMQNDLFLRYPNYTSLLKDMRKYLDTVPDARKAGPQNRRSRLRRAAAGAAKGSASAPAGAAALGHGGETAPPSGTAEASGSPAATPSGRRGFVIQKGSISSVPRTLSMSSVSVAPAPTVATGEVAPRGRWRKVLKVVLISVLSTALLAGAVFGIYYVVKNSGKAKAQSALFTQAKAAETEWHTVSAAVTTAVVRVAERDADARKVLAAAGEIVVKALSTPLTIPDLEPVKPSPPAADAPSVVEGAVPGPGIEGVQPLTTEVAASPDKPTLVVKAEALFVPARQIRVKLRESEALREAVEPALPESKRETVDAAQRDELKARVVRRRQAVTDITAMAKECDGLLVEMRRAIPTLEKEAAGLAGDARRREEAARLAREQAAAAEAREREERERQARVGREVAYVQEQVQQRRPLADKYDYARVVRELERMRPDVATDGGKAALTTAIDQFTRLDALRAFILRDLHENKGLKWGLGTVDIIDADDTGLTAVGGRKVALETVTIPQWMNLIVKLLETRGPERRIGVIEHGEQLFNAAIFCVTHGGGAESAQRKAETLVRMALKLRTALRPDVARLLPALAGANLDE